LSTPAQAIVGVVVLAAKGFFLISVRQRRARLHAGLIPARLALSLCEHGFGKIGSVILRPLINFS